MQQFQIGNHDVSVQVRALGAELCSLFDRRNQRELIWQGDPEIWAGSAPILFPVVGRLRGGSFAHRGRRYRMPIHGFAASQRFSVVAHTEHSVTLELWDSEETRAVYPFGFQLQVNFTVQGAALGVEYRVHNPEPEPLYFSLGSHPAFALPGSSMQEAAAEIRFDQEEAGHCHRIRDELLSAPEPVALADGRLVLRGDTFASDAIILRDLRSRRVSLWTRGRQLLSMDTGGAPHLGLWAKPDAPYVCLEPWLTTDDGPDAVEEISQKPGFIALAAGESFHTGYRVEF